MLRSFLLTVLLIASLNAVADSEPFTAEHLVRIDRVGAPAASPDGERVVFAVRHADVEANKAAYDLWISATDGATRRKLTTHSASDHSPAWTADGSHVLFLSSRGGSSQVWRLSMAGGEAQPVTDLPLSVTSFRLTPDGKRLVVSMSVYLDCESLECSAERVAEEPEDSGQAYDQLFMRHWDHWLDEQRSQLFAIPLDEGLEVAGEPVRVSRVDADVPSRVWGGSEEYALSPDGATVYFTARLRNGDEPRSTNFDIYAASLDGAGGVSNLTEANLAWDTQPILSPAGDQLAWLAMNRAGFEADQFQVMLRNLETGETRNLTENWDRSPSAIQFTPDGQALLLTAQDVGRRSLWRLELADGALRPIVEGGTVTGFDTGGSKLILGRQSLASPTELYVSNLHGDGITQLTRFGDRVLEDVAFGSYEQFSFTGAGDAKVYGYVVRPVGFEAGQRYPVAFLIHGGPQGSFSDSFHYRWNPQTYAGQGFAAVFIDFHGSTGYGQAFTDAISGDWGGKPLEDLQLGLAAALERYPFLDGDRVCALGASYGGYMVNWIAGNWPDRFRCLVNHDGIFDLRSMYYTTEELWFPEWEFGGPYFDATEAYERHNPANFVDQWQTPMLVIHGELDYRVPVTQGIAAFTALQRLGVESRFLYFPDENHWVLKPKNSLRWHREVNAWLARYLN